MIGVGMARYCEAEELNRHAARNAFAARCVFAPSVPSSVNIDFFLTCRRMSRSAPSVSILITKLVGSMSYSYKNRRGTQR